MGLAERFATQTMQRPFQRPFQHPSQHPYNIPSTPLQPPFQHPCKYTTPLQTKHPSKDNNNLDLDILKKDKHQ